MNIAIYGGSFNPVHSEHIALVKHAVDCLNLDKVIIIPSAQTPNKVGKLSCDAEQRLQMCRLAFSCIPCAEVSDWEIRKGGVSYTYYTAEAFARAYPRANRYLLVGEDVLEDFENWYNPQGVLKFVTLAPCARGGSKKFGTAVEKFKEKFGAEVAPVDFVGKDISSTTIRTLAAFGEDVSAYTCPSVAEYIGANKLYALQGLDKVKKFLTPERYAHTLRVAILAAKVAALHRVSEQDAVLAAGLHDVAKYLSMSSPYLSGFTLPEGVPQSVIHQFSGAYVATNTFKIKNEEIIDAIKFHTTGRENMTVLGKIIFLADMLEEGRTFNGVEQLRQLFFVDLDMCLYTCLMHQVNYLSATGKQIYPLTQRAYDYMKSQILKRK